MARSLSGDFAAYLLVLFPDIDSVQEQPDARACYFVEIASVLWPREAVLLETFEPKAEPGFVPIQDFHNAPSLPAEHVI